MTFFINKVRNLIFSPSSRFELFLRSTYHKLSAIRTVFLLQNFMAERSYRRYRQTLQNNNDPELNRNVLYPKISFLLHYSKENHSDFIKTLNSIKDLDRGQWEVIILLPAQDEISPFSGVNDPRIIILQSNLINLPEKISGEYAVFCQTGDVFYKPILTHLFNYLDGSNKADIIYYDCEYFDNKINKFRPLFKPAAISPALLLSVNYLSRSFIKQNIIEKLWPVINLNQEYFCLENEIITKLYESGKTFHHLPVILLAQNKLAGAHTETECQTIANRILHTGSYTIKSNRESPCPHFNRDYIAPGLAIVIPTKNNHHYLQELIPSLLAQKYDGSFSIYLVDNNSKNSETLNFYKEISKKQNIFVIPYTKAFNFSEAINLGVSSNDSDLILLLNDDMKAIDNNCINELAQWATLPDVGVVGAKLLRKNRTIQHAGIIIGIAGYAGHVYLNAAENYSGLFGSVNWYRNYLALTGACQMFRRDVFNQVNGYDEAYSLAFGDVDFCIRVHNAGYQNVYNPFARLFHYEGSSRGHQTPVEDILKGYDLIDQFLVEGDPYFSPNLTYSRIPKCALSNDPLNDRVKIIQSRKNFYLNQK